MLDVYTFTGKVEFMTFTGPEEWPIAFTLIRAPYSDEMLLDNAAKAIGQFLIEEHYLPDIIEDEEDDERV